MMRGALTLVVLLTLATLPMAAQAQSAPGVEIDCDEKQPEMDVHPLNTPTVEITCTITNPSSFEETIAVEKEWEGTQVDMLLSEDSFTLAAGEEEDFTVSFNGVKRLSATESWGFTLTATVTNVGMLTWPEQLASNASVSGDLNIAAFGMVDLDIGDTSTRTLGEGEETKVTFQFSNNGNDRDNIRVDIVNADELKALGFTFPSGVFVSENVDEGGTSSLKELVIRSPSDIAEATRHQVVFQASSGNDDDAQVSEMSISVQLEAASESNALGGGLEEVSKDDVVLYGGIAGAVLFGLVLLVAMARILRNKANAQPMVMPTVNLPDDDPEEDAFDFDDLDDLDDLDDDFDDVFADL
jgi:hypothetical protein